MIRKIAILFGGCALLAATGVDTIAVIGRHLGFPLRGSIEIMQALVLVSGASAMVVATLAGAHARVRIIVDRLSGAARLLADHSSQFLTALLFLLLLCGSGWLAFDLWGSHEVSEVLGVPWWLMRLFANICLFLGFAISLRQMIGRSPR